MSTASGASHLGSFPHTSPHPQTGSGRLGGTLQDHMGCGLGPIMVSALGEVTTIRTYCKGLHTFTKGPYKVPPNETRFFSPNVQVSVKPWEGNMAKMFSSTLNYFILQFSEEKHSSEGTR